jgi:hypothetical protein
MDINTSLLLEFGTRDAGVDQGDVGADTLQFNTIMDGLVPPKLKIRFRKDGKHVNKSYPETSAPKKRGRPKPPPLTIVTPIRRLL